MAECRECKYFKVNKGITDFAGKCFVEPKKIERNGKDPACKKICYS